ncbi:hypothetical protein I6N95_16360 [Vagococcus sp. BWB3-3]|uniref:Uncharacterized protein n=1 Tax=Vagococcus allomyrinae TaxID=2794353 RepID=A0A940P7P5_9ENTE|nr:hypothetical protein [Vagococcus allomyrinae]MBP1042590.1 hypothetical protein [Vagococcus allomyrinae]
MSETEKAKELIEKNKQKQKLQALIQSNKGNQASFGKSPNRDNKQKGQKNMKRSIKNK